MEPAVRLVGRAPGVAHRVQAALQYLKHVYALSDEALRHGNPVRQEACLTL